MKAWVPLGKPVKRTASLVTSRQEAEDQVYNFIKEYWNSKESLNFQPRPVCYTKVRAPDGKE